MIPRTTATPITSAPHSSAKNVRDCTIAASALSLGRVGDGVERVDFALSIRLGAAGRLLRAGRAGAGGWLSDAVNEQPLSARSTQRSAPQRARD